MSWWGLGRKAVRGAELGFEIGLQVLCREGSARKKERKVIQTGGHSCIRVRQRVAWAREEAAGSGLPFRRQPD